MVFCCSFWRCGAKNDSGSSTPIELMPEAATGLPKIKLTSAIYNPDNSIKWSDEATKTLIFSKGLQDNSVENYVFLYDCYRMRTLFKSSESEMSHKEKDKQIRELATELYDKHILGTKEYFVEIKGGRSPMRMAINISDVLKARIGQIHLQIEKKSTTDIMAVYEQAVDEIIGMLLGMFALPPPPLKRTRITSLFSLGGGSFRTPAYQVSDGAKLT